MTLQFEKLISNLYAKRTISRKRSSKASIFCRNHVIDTEQDLISSQLNNDGLSLGELQWCELSNETLTILLHSIMFFSMIKIEI